MLLHWNDSYQTGHAAIDNQHRSIINAMNQIHAAVEAGKIIEEMPAILEFLDNYVHKHFHFEENCAERYHCPNALKNKEAHREFEIRVREIREQYENKPFTRPEALDVYYEMIAWIKNHILSVDVPNFHCVRKNFDTESDTPSE